MGENLAFVNRYICNHCNIHWIRCRCDYVPDNIAIDQLTLPQNFIIIDIETTGTNASKDAIVEIGGVNVDLRNTEITPAYHAICNELPEKPINPKRHWIFKHSNLSYIEVMKAPHFNSISKSLEQIIENNTITAFNKPFDIGFLQQRGIQIQNSTKCLMQWTRKIIGLRQRNGATKPPKAQEAWNFLFPEIPRKEPHRALLDAEFEALITLKTWKLLQRKLHKVKSP